MRRLKRPAACVSPLILPMSCSFGVHTVLASEMCTGALLTNRAAYGSLFTCTHRGAEAGPLLVLVYTQVCVVKTQEEIDNLEGIAIEESKLLDS